MLDTYLHYYAITEANGLEPLSYEAFTEKLRKDSGLDVPTYAEREERDDRRPHLNDRAKY